MTLDSLPDLEYKRVVSCKDSFHGTDVLAVSEHGAPGRRPALRRSPKGGRPRYPRQTEAPSSRTSRSRPWKRRSQAVRERARVDVAEPLPVLVHPPQKERHPARVSLEERDAQSWMPL